MKNNMQFRIITMAALAACWIFAATMPARGGVWQMFIGDKNDEQALGAVPDGEGGFVLAGWTTSFGASSTDILVIRCDANGNVLWRKTYGGHGTDVATSLAPAADGGFLIGGVATTGGRRVLNLYIVKIDGQGNKLWDRTFGDARINISYALNPTADGGYILASNDSLNRASSSAFLPFENFLGGQDAFARQFDEFPFFPDPFATVSLPASPWYDQFRTRRSEITFIKLDAAGNTQWTERCCGTGFDLAYDIREARGGGYIVAGQSRYASARGSDFMVMRLDERGGAVWTRYLGDIFDDAALSVTETLDQGFVAAGSQGGIHAETGQALVVRLSPGGDVLWQRALGGEGLDMVFSIKQTQDMGFIAAGLTESYGRGLADVYAIKLRHDGEIQWEASYGGRRYDRAASVLPMNGNGYLLLGVTESWGAREADVYVIKTDENGVTGPDPE